MTGTDFQEWTLVSASTKNQAVMGQHSAPGPPPRPMGHRHSCDPEAETRGGEAGGGMPRPGRDWAHADGQMTGGAGRAVC